MAYDMVLANWSRYSFVIDPSIEGKGYAGYNPYSKTFSFLRPSSIDAKFLTEEVIHAAQDLAYPNGISGRPKPNIEFEAKFLVEINNLYELWCCDKTMLLPNQGEQIGLDLRKWVENGSVNLDEYFKWVEAWCKDPNSECYGKENLINRNLAPTLLQKFIKEKKNCLKL